MQYRWSRLFLAMAFCLVPVIASQAQSTQAPAAPAPSSPATAPAATRLTPEERNAALKSLQATRDAFLQSIAGLSEKQWKFKSGPDRWSVAEVSEHITVAETSIFGLVQGRIMQGPPTPDK